MWPEISAIIVLLLIFVVYVLRRPPPPPVLPPPPPPPPDGGGGAPPRRRALRRNAAGGAQLAIIFLFVNVTLAVQHNLESEQSFAWQRFMPSGPVALLLLGPELCSLVWTVPNVEAARLLQLSTEHFVEELNATLHCALSSSTAHSFINDSLDCLGRVLAFIPSKESLAKRPFPRVVSLPYDDHAAFSLSLGYAHDYVRPRVALIGDAAHRVHPLAGQGVNLGWSDVRFLANSLQRAFTEGGDFGSMNCLREFDSACQKRNVPIAVAIDCLNRLYSTDRLPFRSVGFNILGRFLSAKAFPCREDVKYAPGCCWTVFGKLECYYPFGSANCNIFGNNCVVCEFLFPNIGNCDYIEVQCSCFYCCDPQYAQYCIDGCRNCHKDGEGGCPENGGGKMSSKFISSAANSSLVSVPKKSVEKLRQEFNTIDADKSGAISLKEAIAYLVQTKNGTSADQLAKDISWFVDMDSNANNGIEPVEFDRSLI